MSSGSELAGALRAWRERLTPERAGLPGGGDRRVPGLRREELALLAGVSVDYLVRLEQGRASNPSPSVTAALASALRLSTAERGLLHQMAGLAPPSSGPVPTRIPRGVRVMIDRMADTPLAVFTAAWDPVHWNPLWAALLGDPSTRDGRARNLVWRQFSGALARVVIHDAGREEAHERELVADLRRASEKYPDDRAVAELISALHGSSPRFQQLWERFESIPASSAQKTILHPEAGRLTLDCDVLTLDGSDLRIVLYSAVSGSDADRRLEQLRRSLTHAPGAGGGTAIGNHAGAR